MAIIPSDETRKSERYHELYEKLLRKHGYKESGLWKIPKDKVGEIPREELDILIWYPPIDEVIIPQKQPYHPESE